MTWVNNQNHQKKHLKYLKIYLIVSQTFILVLYRSKLIETKVGLPQTTLRIYISIFGSLKDSLKF